MQVAARVMSVALALPVGATLVVRFVGLDTRFPWVALVTVLPWLLPLALLAGLVAATARWWPGVGIAGVALVVGLLVVAPRVLPGPNPPPPPDGAALTIAVANLRLGLADADAVVAAVEAEGVDVLVTLELTEDAIERLSTAGLDDVLPEAVLEPSRFTSGGGIHSALPLTALPANEDRGFGRTPRATVRVDGVGEVAIDAVHPLPPIQADWAEQWRAALLALPGPEGGGRRVLAGDFNATLDHAPFRALLHRGWTDAGDAVGRGLVPTFNALPWGEPVPPVTLDHVLVDADTHVAGLRVRHLPNSDHRIVVVDLVLPT